MQTRTFQARNAQEAVAQIRNTLGPQAVVLQVRKVRPSGWAGWLGRTAIEVVAALPEPEPAQATREALEELKRELAGLRAIVERQPPFTPAAAPSTPPEDDGPVEPGELTDFLRRLGLLPQFARSLALSAAGAAPAAMNRRQMLALVQSLLQQQWRVPPPLQPHALHLLVGPPGVGKTTALCKWLARLVLRENQSARVWCADGERPNLSETLRLHAELLGVPVARLGGHTPPPNPSASATWQFVDLPGIPWQNTAALEALQQRFAACGPVQWHLVLSAAYDTSLLLQQARAFAALPLAGILVTHIDEQPALGRLWNLLCGTNCSVRFLAGGQNIPGDFSPATPAALGPPILWADSALFDPPPAPVAAGKASAMQTVADW
ncbi:MAG: AAA family ATPase [Verrucomicrobiae bacterium]|nr:AAA family ATPase [Verrucomicrobiae bacterium]